MKKMAEVGVKRDCVENKEGEENVERPKSAQFCLDKETSQHRRKCR